jgi:formylglycine-generating enzyme
MRDMMENNEGTLIGEGGYYGINLENLPAGYLLDNRYEIIERLGKGGFGTVYKAVDHYLEDCFKAIKVISSQFYDDKIAMSQLKEEATRMIKLNHPNIVRLFDVHLDGEVRYLDMEYVDGGDLSDLMLKYPQRKVPEEQVIEISHQIAAGMQHIHAHNVIHKDIKPQNIMLTQTGVIKISDFGISETFRSSQSRLKESRRSGTLAYMSPEQLIGKDVGKETDIWSFGVMLYELLTGKVLYSGESYADVLLQIERNPFQPISGISKKTNNLLTKCLQYKYQTRISDFISIQKYLSSKGKTPKVTKPKPDSKKPKAESLQSLPADIRPKKRKSALPGIILLIILSVAATIIIPRVIADNEYRQMQQSEMMQQEQISDYLKQGEYYFRNSDYTRAREQYDAVLELDESNSTARDRLRAIAAKEQEAKEAREREEQKSKFQNQRSNQGIELIAVQGGSFDMGSNDGDSDEKPIHSVTLSDFYIGKYEVTQEQYEKVMGKNPSDFKNSGKNAPVESVTWYDAVEFCNKLSEQEGLQKCYSGSGNSIKCDFSKNGYRLPTEAEWEYAAKGGSKSKGYKYSGSNNLGEVGWYEDNSGGKTHSVGGKKSNELGIYDMSGNVWEWCWDWYGDYSSSAQTNPHGQGSGSYRVLRGGSWFYYARYCRTANRNVNLYPTYSNFNVGFRLSRANPY